MPLLSSLRDAPRPARKPAPAPRPQPPQAVPEEVRTTRPAMLSSGTTRWDLLERFAPRGPDDPLYDFGLAMSAPAFFPWLRVGVERACVGLAGLPLRHAATGDLFRGAPTRDRLMWWVSYHLCDEVWAMDRAYLHPARGWVADGIARGWRDDDGDEVAADVQWHRGLTFSTDTNHRGTSAVRSLQAVLNTEFNVDRHSARAARRGQVSALLTPASDSVALGPELREEIEDDWQARREEGIDLYVLPQSLKITPMELSARDQEFSTVVQRAQSAALAAMGVPPTMAGLPGANYGTAREESRGFWLRALNLCGGDDPTSGMNGFLSRVYGVPLVHDFSAVPALRTLYADMVQTARVLEALGMSPRDALTAAGLPAAVAGLAPSEPVDRAGPDGRPPKPSQTDEPRERLAAVLRRMAADHAAGTVDAERHAVSLAGALADCGADSGAAAEIVRGQSSAVALGRGEPASLRAFGVSWVLRCASAPE